jgi:hypothetical protein
MNDPGSSSGRTSYFECENPGSNPGPGTNAALLAREAAAELGALDPKPEPAVVFQGPTRLIRVVDERGEVWIDPRNGREFDGE